MTLEFVNILLAHISYIDQINYSDCNIIVVTTYYDCIITNNKDVIKFERSDSNLFAVRKYEFSLNKVNRLNLCNSVVRIKQNIMDTIFHASCNNNSTLEIKNVTNSANKFTIDCEMSNFRMENCTVKELNINSNRNRSEKFHFVYIERCKIQNLILNAVGVCENECSGSIIDTMCVNSGNVTMNNTNCQLLNIDKNKSQIVSTTWCQINKIVDTSRSIFSVGQRSNGLCDLQIYY